MSVVIPFSPPIAGRYRNRAVWVVAVCFTSDVQQEASDYFILQDGHVRRISNPALVKITEPPVTSA